MTTGSAIDALRAQAAQRRTPQRPTPTVVPRRRRARARTPLTYAERRRDAAETAAYRGEDPAELAAGADFVAELLRPPAWHADARCRKWKHLSWYPERGQPVDELKAVCAGCPVREPCLEWALDAGEKFGIWGGKSERERRELRGQRRRGEAPPPESDGASVEGLERV